MEEFMVKKLKDSIYGLAIGDALGVPYEFETRGTFSCTDMIGYGTYNQPEGTWSDDTSMTIATCKSIKNRNCIDLKDIREQFERWLFDHEFTANGDLFDCGNTCYFAIKNKIGQNGEFSNGNGSLMRIIPLAFVKNVTDQEIRDVSAITHAHNISTDVCVKYVHIAKKLLNNSDVKEAIREVISTDFLRDLQTSKEDSIKSDGYVVNSFNASLWCLVNTNSYKECVLKAVNLGDDTDTTAAIAGALAGIIYGYDNIPKEWIEKLKGKSIIENCLF